MKILDRYIGAAVVLNAVYALLTLVAVFSVISLMEELRDIGTGEYGAAAALRYVALMLPTQAFEMFPAAALLGSVTGLSQLANHHELVGMQAAGVSPARITAAVLLAAALLVASAAAVGELVAAPLAQRAQSNRALAMSSGEAMTGSGGMWARSGTRFVNVRDALANGSLRDVYVYDFDGERRLRTFTYAKTAFFDADRWVLEDVVESVLGDDGEVATERSVSRVWDTFLTPRQLRVLSYLPENLSLLDLHRSIESLRSRQQSPLRHQLAFWRRLSMPLLTGVMVYLAVPFILGAGPRVTTGQRIVVAVLVGVGFRMFSEVFASMGLVYGLNPALTAFLPGILVLAAAFAWNWRHGNAAP
jgi:lipopolysaccharide export system permease protein